MSESTDELRRAAISAALDLRQLAAKHLPEIRRSTREILERDLPKVAGTVRQELPRVARAVQEEVRKRRSR